MLNNRGGAAVESGAGLTRIGQSESAALRLSHQGRPDSRNKLPGFERSAYVLVSARIQTRNAIDCLADCRRHLE